MNAQTIRAWYLVHKWTSLVCTVFLMMLCITGLSQPLHFGDYGGLPLKIIWALLDVIAIIVLGSGLYLWLARRRRPIEEELEDLARGGAVRDVV